MFWNRFTRPRVFGIQDACWFPVTRQCAVSKLLSSLTQIFCMEAETATERLESILYFLELHFSYTMNFLPVEKKFSSEYML